MTPELKAAGTSLAACRVEDQFSWYCFDILRQCRTGLQMGSAVQAKYLKMKNVKVSDQFWWDTIENQRQLAVILLIRNAVLNGMDSWLIAHYSCSELCP